VESLGFTIRKMLQTQHAIFVIFEFYLADAAKIRVRTSVTALQHMSENSQKCPVICVFPYALTALRLLHLAEISQFRISISQT